MSTDPAAHPEPGFLTPALAQEIAGETSAIIGLHILITNADGIVIGSGDPSRVGEFHEASVEVVRTQESAAHNAEQARRLHGVLPGMTLPIIHDGVAIGTVGITGTPAQARRFGQVVRRQTEILLEQAVLLRSRMTRERVLESLLRDLLTYDDLASADLETRAADFGFDLSMERRVIVLDVPSGGSQTVVASTLPVLRQVFRDSQDLSCALSDSRFVVLRGHSVGRADLRRSDLQDLAGRVEQGGRPAQIGVGGVASGIAGIAGSYDEALIALRVGPGSGRQSPYNIGDLRIEQLMRAVPAPTRRRITAQTLDLLRSEGDWPATRETVIAWVESGFVLVDAAATLRIHRNTLVYRLGRIAERTGWPTGERRRWLVLYLACIADGVPD